MYRTLLGSVIVLRSVPANAIEPIPTTLSGMLIAFKEQQPQKAPSSMRTTCRGMSITSRLLHPANEKAPIFRRLYGRITFFNPGMLEKHLGGSIHTSSLMTATLPPSFIFAFSLIHCSNIRILSFRFCSYKNMRNVIGI